MTSYDPPHSARPDSVLSLKRQHKDYCSGRRQFEHRDFIFLDAASSTDSRASPFRLTGQQSYFLLYELYTGGS